MRLSVDCSVMSNRFGDFRAVEMIRQAGFDALDYSFYDRAPEHPIFGENFKAYAMQLREHLDKNNIVCNQAHAPYGFVKYGGKFDMSNPGYQVVVRSIEAAAILGAETTVVHGIWPFDIDGVSEEEVVASNKAFYRSLVPYCEAYGIHVAVENLMRYDANFEYCASVASTPEALREIVKAVDSPWMVACLDVGHASLMKIDPENFALGLDGGILKALHMHDTDYIEDLHIMPFLANIHWVEVMKSLKKIGYTGDFTFEILEYLKKFPDAVLPDALKLAASIGRYLISVFESA